MLRVIEILAMQPESQEITFHGWIKTKRESKDVVFLEMTDGSSIKSLQGVAERSRFPEDYFTHLLTGASVEVTGRLVPSTGQNQDLELSIDRCRVIGQVAPDYPLQKKKHSFEFLRDIAHLRARTNTIGAVSRVSNTLAYSIHSFFQKRGFIWLRSPVITTIDAEGAGNMFQVTTLPVDEGKKPDYQEDFFGRKAFLTVTGQLEAETYACALGRVYTFGPTFRAENSNTTRHLAEFWMVEPEVAFCDITGDMDLAEEFLKYIFSEVLKENSDDMEFLDKWICKGIIETLSRVIETDFERITYTEAIGCLEKSNAAFEFSPSWGCDLQSEHEKCLTETVFKKPVIVTGYPKEIKAFYMKQNDDGKTVRAMDVLVPRLGEIIGGSEREDDYTRLMTRMDELGMRSEDYGWYLDLRRHGSVPHAGFGLGFERTIQYVTGMQNIRDAIPYPRTVKNARF